MRKLLLQPCHCCSATNHVLLVGSTEMLDCRAPRFCRGCQMLHHRDNTSCWGTIINRPSAELAYQSDSWPILGWVEARRRAIRPDRHKVEPGLEHVLVMRDQETSQQPNDAWLSLVTPPPSPWPATRWSGEGTVKVSKTA